MLVIDDAGLEKCLAKVVFCHFEMKLDSYEEITEQSKKRDKSSVEEKMSHEEANRAK